MGKYKDFLNNKSFIVPINLFTFNPCKEWVILKLKFSGLYVKASLIINELLYKGITVEETAGLLTKITELSKKHSHERVIEIVERYVKAKRIEERTDGGL